jgi:hypothetical protein
MEVLVKKQQVTPVGVALKLLRASEERPPALFVPKKNAYQAARQITYHFAQIPHVP